MYGAQNARTKVIAYYGLDLSPADTEAATNMSKKYITPTATITQVQTADMGKEAWMIPDTSVDTVTCQLALHYLCDEEVHVRHFFQESARILNDHGLLLVSFADGRSIVRRAREAADGRWVSRYYTLDVPAASRALYLASPFGNQYTFTMPGSVENVPEYLCHEGIITKIASEYGFHAGKSLYFDELAVALDSESYYHDIAQKMGGNGIQDPDALDTSNLYRFIVFGKAKSALADFNACLKYHPPGKTSTPSTTETNCRPSLRSEGSSAAARAPR